MADASPKKEKKDKKDKKDKKKEKKEKKKQQITALGESVEAGTLKSNDDYLDNERFKPVPNPAFNPALSSPLTSPVTSIKSRSSASADEKWTISSKRTGETLPIVQTNQQLTPAGENTSPLTPAELQGFAAQKYVPSSGYAHLDPAKHENAHSAFDHLQKVIMAGKEGEQAKSPPQHQSNPQLRQAQPQQQQPQQRPAQQQQQRPAQQQQRLSPQQQRLSPQQRPSQPQQTVAGKGKSRPERLADGAPVLQYVRALWNYIAQIPSELTFNANDSFAVLSRQPDGWWYAELLDKKKRGLVPGNYMTPN